MPKIILAIITINYYNKVKITLKDRTYVCDCGYTEDRDVHASKNVKLFGSTKRTECLEQASAEASVTTQSIASQLVMQIESVKRKQEATTLKGGV